MTSHECGATLNDKNTFILCKLLETGLTHVHEINNRDLFIRFLPIYDYDFLSNCPSPIIAFAYIMCSTFKQYVGQSGCELAHSFFHYNNILGEYTPPATSENNEINHL